MPHPSAIIFDLDGTLYHMRFYFRPLLLLHVLPHAMRLPAYMRVRGRVAGRDFGSGEALMDALAAELAREVKVEPDEAGVAEMRDWIEKRFYPAFLRVMPWCRWARIGLNEVLAPLRESGVRMAVLSDFARVRERLELLHTVTDVFDAIASAEEYGALKPSPRPFRDIASRWDLPMEDILVIGDRDDTDGEAARACGMQFMQITDHKTSTSTAKSWKEVREVLWEMVGGGERAKV